MEDIQTTVSAVYGGLEMADEGSGECTDMSNGSYNSRDGGI